MEHLWAPGCHIQMFYPHAKGVNFIISDEKIKKYVVGYFKQLIELIKYKFRSSGQDIIKKGRKKRTTLIMNNDKSK